MVHDVWSTTFNQCYKTVFFSINFKIKGLGVPCYHYLGETLISGICSKISFSIVQNSINRKCELYLELYFENNVTCNITYLTILILKVMTSSITLFQINKLELSNL